MFAHQTVRFDAVSNKAGLNPTLLSHALNELLDRLGLSFHPAHHFALSWARVRLNQGPSLPADSLYHARHFGTPPAISWSCGWRAVGGHRARAVAGCATVGLSAQTEERNQR